MFDSLRNAFSNAAKSLGEKELKEKDIEDTLFQLEISLMESDVATEVIESLKSDLKEKLIGTKVNKHEIENFVKNSLVQSISSLFDSAGTLDLLENIRSKKKSNPPYTILFLGINGTGKTTTLAKLAYLLQQSKFSVVVAASDTFRAGAIEQLREHMNRLKLKLVAQNYGSDPAAVARDAVLYAKSHKVDCVLIDTAGRMQTSKNLMDQIEKITNVVKPDFKIFVGDALAGNDTVNQAREFFEHTNFDAAILTKADADARGGAALSIVKVTSKPVIYLGVGQEYGDLKPFDKEVFLKTVFGKFEEKQTKQEPKVEMKPKSKPDAEKAKSETETQPEAEKIPEPIHKIETKPKVETTRESFPEIETSEHKDPFEGIDTNDINRYVELFDVSPPENDQLARQMANKIKQWISDGRPKPDEIPEKIQSKEGEEPEKSKKKRSLFGRFKK